MTRSLTFRWGSRGRSRASGLPPTGDDACVLVGRCSIFRSSYANLLMIKI